MKKFPKVWVVNKFVDNPDFRKFLHDIDSKFTPPCRQTVTNSHLPKLLNTERDKLQNVLNGGSSISLTAVIWTDRRAHSFLGVTVHMFSSGVPKSYLLAFRTFEGSHTGQRIAEELDAVMEEFHIVCKTLHSLQCRWIWHRHQCRCILRRSKSVGRSWRWSCCWSRITYLLTYLLTYLEVGIICLIKIKEKLKI